MTTPDSVGPNDTESRLSAALASGDEQEALRTVAGADVVLPQAPDQGDTPADAISLPVVEQDGRQFVPVFTSERMLTTAAPDVSRSVTVPASQLAAAWPQEDELWMAVNPGSSDGVTLPPDVVRTLAAYSAG